MDFGLGLVLSFTDNATAGINNAVNSLNNLTSVAESASASMNQMASLSALSVVSDKIGSSFLNAGSSILGMFGNVLNETKNIGQEFEDFDVTLTALFGGATEGANKSQEALSKLFNFAKKSPLEVGDVKDMIVTLQSQGINAFDEATGAISNTRQEYLAFLTDLKSFKPEVSNERFKMAIQNYIGSGEKKMMRTVFDMGDIEQIIGHGVSDTAEGRMNDIIEMVEKKGLTGLSDAMSKTWGGVASNISDAFTQIYYSIASNGVFDKLKNAFVGLANQIIELEPERLQAMGKTIAEGLNIIVNPIVKVAKFMGDLVGKVIDLCETNPALVKFMMTMTAIAGVLLVAIGVVLKATSAFSGLSLMILASGKSVSALATTMRTGILKLLATLLPFIATVGLLALAWKIDFAGIQSNTKMFLSGVQNSFQTARQAVNGSVEGMITTLNGLRSKNDFFSNLTIGIMKLMVLLQALKESWNDFTLSDETFQKAKELGILPLIEAIFDLKYRFGLFKEGFIAGWKEIGESVKSMFSGLKDAVKGTFIEDMLDNLTSFLQKLAGGDAQAWYDFGNSFAHFTAKAIAFWAVFKVADSVIGKLVKVATAVRGISKVFSVFSKVGSKAVGLVTKSFPNLINAITKIPSAISSVVGFVSHAVSGVIGFFQLVGEYGLSATMEGLFGSVATVIAGVVSTIGGVVLAFVNFFSMLKNGFSWLKEALMVLGVALATIGVIILAPIEGVGIAIAAIVGAIVAVVMTAVVLIKQYWNEICSFFSSIADWINSNVIQPIVNFFSPMFDLISQMWNSLAQTVSHVVERIKGFIDELKSGVKSIWDNIISYIQPCIDTFNDLRQTFGEFCSFIGQKLSDLWTGTIQPVLSNIGGFFSSVFSTIGSIISSVMSAIWNVITSIWNAIWSFISPIVMSIWNTIQSVFTSIFDTIMNVMSSIWQGIVGVFNGIVTFIGSILSGIFQTISNILMAIMNFIMGKHDEAKQNISNAWEAIKSIFSGALQGIAQIVSSIFTAIGNVISSIWNGIKSFFSAIWNGIVSIFSSVLSSISSVVSGAFNSIKSFITSAMNAVKSVVSSIWSAITGVFSSAINTAKSAVTNGINAIKSGFSNGLNAVKSTVSSVFDSIKSKISSVMEGAKSIVTSAVSKFKSAFNFSWKLPDLKLPHVSVSGGEAPFGIAGKGSLPKFSVSWYKQGGVFDKPSVIGVGEAGTEAVMPLENNTEWIGTLASMITSKMGQMSSLTPVNNTTSNSTVNNDGESYLTTNNNSTQNVGGNTDNSVTFNQGAIQINVQNASEEEALKLAKFIMQYIQRQTQLNNMAQYA